MADLQRLSLKLELAQAWWLHCCLLLLGCLPAGLQLTPATPQYGNHFHGDRMCDHDMLQDAVYDPCTQTVMFMLIYMQRPFCSADRRHLSVCCQVIWSPAQAQLPQALLVHTYLTLIPKHAYAAPAFSVLERNGKTGRKLPQLIRSMLPCIRKWLRKPHLKAQHVNMYNHRECYLQRCTTNTLCMQTTDILYL